MRIPIALLCMLVIFQEAQEPRRDPFGDPIPAGATRRLGTLRFRHGHSVEVIAWSPDGKFIAASDTSPVVLFDAATGEIRHRLGDTSSIQRMAFSPDGQSLALGASVGNYGGIRVCDLSPGDVPLEDRKEPYFELAPSVSRVVAFSPDGGYLAYGGEGRTLVVRDVAKGKVLFETEKQPGWIGDIAFSPDGKLFASAMPNEGVQVWTVDEKGGLRARAGLLSEGAGSVAFSPDGKTLASGGDPEIHLWSTDTFEEVRVLEGHEQSVVDLEFSPDGKTLASGSHDGFLCLWDPATGRPRHRIRSEPRRLYSLAFSPDGRTIASAGSTASVRLWDVETGKDRFPVEGHHDRVWELTFSEDGKTLASAGWHGGICFWEMPSGRPAGRLDGPMSGVGVMGWSRDRMRFISAGQVPVVPRWAYVWDLASGRRTRDIELPTGQHRAYALTPDRRTLVTTCRDGLVRFVDLESGEEVRKFQGPTGPVHSMSVSPDGSRLALGTEGGKIHILDPASGEERIAFQAHDPRVNGHGWIGRLQFFPDGRRLASIGEDGLVRLSHASDGSAYLELRPEQGRVRGLAMSRDGRLVAAGTWDHLVNVWEVSTGKRVFLLQGHGGVVNCLAFSPDQRILASGSSDTTVLIWDLAPGVTDPADVKALWPTLGGGDASAAYIGIHRLARNGDAAADLIRNRLRAEPPDPAVIQGHLDDIDSDDFETREGASRALARHHVAILPHLRKALAGDLSAEARTRVEALIQKLEPPFRESPSEALARRRAIHALELMGTDRAREVLHWLAETAPAEAEREDARRSLGRLDPG